MKKPQDNLPAEALPLPPEPKETVKKAETPDKEIKKQAIPQPKPKFYFDVKVECMIPATLTYRVLAEDPTQAAELIKGKQPNSVQHKLIGRKELVLRVYDASSTMMRLMKKLFGG